MFHSTRLLTLSAFLSMFFLGVGATVIGAASRNIGLSPAEIGILVAAQNLGFMLSVIISGTLADVYDKTKILFAGSLILAVSFPAYYWRESFLLNLVIMAFIGVGIGSYEGVTDAMLIDIHEGREGLYINVNHFFVTFGCIMITFYLLFLQMDWRRSLTQAGFIVFLLALYFLLARSEGGRKSFDNLCGRIMFLRRQKLVLILFFATICATGLEICFIGIVTTFLMELRGLSQVSSKIGLIVFLSGVAIGRIFGGFVTKREKILDLIILSFGVSAVTLSILFLIDVRGLNQILVFLSGAAISAIFPLLITLAGTIYKELSGTVLGLMKLALPAGGMLIPALLSLISKYGSFGLSLVMFPVIALSGLLILSLNRKAFSVPI